MPDSLNDLNGWIIIDKPVGVGSTDVVRVLKRVLHPMKIGHAGTLDPLASGVLPIALGHATKTIPFVMDGIKEYVFTIRFGAETETDDLEGAVINENDCRPTKEMLTSVLPCFLGDIAQVPPVYSAVQVGGKRSYDLARAGKAPVLPARSVHIEALSMTDYQVNEASFTVRCSKGTYVRSLARDIARQAGCLGHVIYLRRIRTGPFTSDKTILLDFFQKMEYNQAVLKILPMETALGDIPELALNREQVFKICQGQALSLRYFPAVQSLENGCNLRFSFEGKTVALGHKEPKGVRPSKVFYTKADFNF